MDEAQRVLPVYLTARMGKLKTDISVEWWWSLLIRSIIAYCVMVKQLSSHVIIHVLQFFLEILSSSAGFASPWLNCEPSTLRHSSKRFWFRIHYILFQWRTTVTPYHSAPERAGVFQSIGRGWTWISCVRVWKRIGLDPGFALCQIWTHVTIFPTFSTFY
jgi:hypothetical protein